MHNKLTQNDLFLGVASIACLAVNLFYPTPVGVKSLQFTLMAVALVFVVCAVASVTARRFLFSLSMLFCVRVGNHWGDAPLLYFAILQPVQFGMASITRYCNVTMILSALAFAATVWDWAKSNYWTRSVLTCCLISLWIAFVSGRCYRIGINFDVAMICSAAGFGVVLYEVWFITPRIAREEKVSVAH